MSATFEQASPWAQAGAANARLSVEVTGGRVVLVVAEGLEGYEACVSLAPDDAHKLAQELLLREAEARGVPVPVRP